MISTFAVAFALLASSVSAGKGGLAWPYYNSPLDPSVFNTGSGNTVAIYDWETYAPPSANGDGGLGFIGTQRCTDCDSSPVGELAARQAAQGWANLFTLNEPDLNGISPGDAASWYQTNINDISTKKAFPSITSSTDAGKGLDWLAQFFTACGGSCSGDYINLHWYGTAYSDFQSHVESAHSKFGDYKIVISEFALTGASQADQVAFFKQAIEWLNGQDYVELFFPFPATSPSLLSANDAAAASYVGTGSCLFNDDGSASAVGELLL